MKQVRIKAGIYRLVFLLAIFLLPRGVAQDITIPTPTVTLAALDKITTRLSTIEITENETVSFGSLAITLRHCRTNPPEETPETVAFLEVVDVGHDQIRRSVFSGWMFASSPALSPLEHPVYDIWVTGCQGATEVRSE